MICTDGFGKLINSKTVLAIAVAKSAISALIMLIIRR